MTFKIITACSLLMLTLHGGAQNKIKPVDIKPFASFNTNVGEPSDIAYNADYTQMFIVNDNGTLHRADTLGKKMRSGPEADAPEATGKVKKHKKPHKKDISRAKESGLDFEGICFYNGLLYVTDERARRIMVYTPDSMNLVRQNELPYLGAMNQGYEAIAYNAAKSCFIVVTEKSPTWLFELNSDLVKINEKKLKIASDLSGLSFHNGFMYALSDEDQMVLQLNPSDYSVIQKWKIPVTNPEGITFDRDGNMVVISDVEQKIYKFKIN